MFFPQPVKLRCAFYRILTELWCKDNRCYFKYWRRIAEEKKRFFSMLQSLKSTKKNMSTQRTYKLLWLSDVCRVFGLLYFKNRRVIVVRCVLNIFEICVWKHTIWILHLFYDTWILLLLYDQTRILRYFRIWYYPLIKKNVSVHPINFNLELEPTYDIPHLENSMEYSPSFKTSAKPIK